MRLSELRQPTTTSPTEEAPLEGALKVLHITYTSPEGEHTAALETHILSMSERLKRDQALVRLAAPARFDELPTAAQLRAWALATIAHAISEPPAWLERWLEYDEGLLFAIYEEVAAHEGAFFRADMEPSEAEAHRPRVVIRALNAPPA